MDCFAGAAELPSNPEKITPRSSFGKILLSSKDGVRDDKVGSLNLFTIVPTVDSLDNQRLLAWVHNPLTIIISRKKLQQNKQSQNNGSISKPKVKRHRTDLDRLYVEYQVVHHHFVIVYKKHQEKIARREKEAKEKELMVKSGKAHFHTREVEQKYLWIFENHVVIVIRRDNATVLTHMSWTGEEKETKFSWRSASPTILCDVFWTESWGAEPGSQLQPDCSAKAGDGGEEEGGGGEYDNKDKQVYLLLKVRAKARKEKEEKERDERGRRRRLNNPVWENIKADIEVTNADSQQQILYEKNIWKM